MEEASETFRQRPQFEMNVDVKMFFGARDDCRLPPTYGKSGHANLKTAKEVLFSQLKFHRNDFQ
jgi:hypothetical protein